MRLYILLHIFICLQYSATAQQKNYKYYHLNINKAEEQAFVQNDIKGALVTYQNTFNQYDFVFVHDCMTAIELALYASNARALLAFVDKGTKNGLMPRHMMYIPYIKKHPLFAKYDDSVAAIYKRNRPGYLAGIDTPALKKMYSLYGYDQMEKNPMKGEGFSMKKSHRYKPQPRLSQNLMNPSNMKMLTVMSLKPVRKVSRLAMKKRTKMHVLPKK